MKRILLVAALLLATVAILAACGEDGSTGIPELDSILLEHLTTEGEPTTSASLTVTITFNSNGGSDVAAQNIGKGEKANKPNDPERTGYTFTGWTYQGENWSFIGYSVTEDITLDANWTPTYYPITYNWNGGYGYNVISYTIETEDFTLQDANKNGYEFLGWTWEGQSEPTKNVTIQKGSCGEKTYTANWSASPTVYSITYDLAGGTLEENPNPTEYTVESEEITFAGTPTRVGYVFAGWGVVDESHGEYYYYLYGYPSTIPSGSYGNMTVTARWNAIFSVSGNSITGLTGTGKQLTAIEIPSEIDGVAITSIGRSAFSGCNELTNITIPNGVTSIGDRALDGCSKLTSVTIPDSVTSIGLFAFEGCNSLQYNEDENAKYLGNESNPYVVLVKAKDSEITFCTIPEQTQVVCIHAFSNCGKLETINWNAINCTDAGNVTSSNGLGGTPLKTVNIGETVETIPAAAFSGCDELTSVTIPNSVKSIGNHAFFGCSGLTSITIPNSVTSIGSSAFFACSGLTSITIPFVGATKDGTSNTHFGYIFGASSGRNNSEYIPSSLKTVIITGGTSIGNYAFYNCSGLTSVTIPNSVTSIGEGAFYGCRGLTSITFENISGWYITKTSGANSGTNMNVTNASTNASNLTTNYDDYYWYRK